MPKVSSIDGLSTKERKFIECYDDNGARAAIQAGYSERSARQIAARLMARDDIRARIEQKQQERLKNIGLTKEDRLKFWRDMMNDPNVKPGDRLKASELLGKANADFVERIEGSQKIDIQVVQRFIEPGGESRQVREAEVIQIQTGRPPHPKK